MNSQHKAIRANLTSMAPKRAIEYIKAFELPIDEENALIECDVRNKSVVQVSCETNVSVECMKRRRIRAYAKIADGIRNATN